MGNSNLLLKLTGRDKRLVCSATSRLALVVVLQSPLHSPTSRHGPQIFRRRRDCSKYPLLLPKFLQSVDWSKAWQVREAYRMLPGWYGNLFLLCILRFFS